MIDARLRCAVKSSGDAARLSGRPAAYSAQGCADGGHERYRVDGRGWGVVAQVHLEVQVRAGGVAAAAGDADDLSDGDVLPFGDIGVDELVAVAGDDVARVFDVDVPAAAGGQVRVAVAVAAPVVAGAGVDGVAAHGGDDTVVGGVDGCCLWRR